MIIFAKEDGRVEASPAFIPKGSGGVPVQVFAPYFAGCTCEVWVNPPSALQLDPIILTPEFGRRSGVWSGKLPPGAADSPGRGEYQLKFTSTQGNQAATLSGTYGVQRGVVDAYPDNMDDLSGYSLASLATLLAQFANRLEDIYGQMVTEDTLCEKMEELPYTMKLTKNILSWGFSGKMLASVLLTGLVGMTGCVFSEKENRESLATLLESVPIIADSESEAAEINTVRETLVESLRAEETEEPEVLASLSVSLTEFKYDAETRRYVVYTGAGSRFKTYADIDSEARIVTEAIYTKGDEISRIEVVEGTVVNGSSAISESEPLYVSYDGKIGEVHFTVADTDTVKASTLYWFGRAITGNSDTGSAVEITRGTTFESLVESNRIYYVVDYENNGTVQSSASDYAEGTLFVGVNNGYDSFDKVLTVSGGTGRKYTIFYGNANMETVGKEVTVDVVADVIPIGIALSQSSAELKVGDTLQLTATVLPEIAADMEVCWQSTSPEYVTVLDGRVSVHDCPPNGSVIISAYPAGYPSLVAMCTVSVVDKYIPVTSVTISQTSATLKVGETLQLTATVLPENATFKEVAWQASPSGYATVKDGLVTIETYPPDGDMWVYAVSSAGGVVSAECYITVEEHVPVAGIALSQSNADELNAGDTLRLTATVLPENATNQNVTWSSSSDIMTVENGLVTVVGLGSATITAQSNDNPTIKASCEITTVEGFAVYPKKYSMKVGETAEIPYFIYPEAENANITIETEEGIEVASHDTTNRKIVIKATQEGEFTGTVLRKDDDLKGIQYFMVTVKASDGGYVDEDGLLHLTPDDGVTTSEIGLQNANVLQEALSQGGTVTLYPGEYPLEPLIVTVDSCTLDMNGSTLTSTVEKYSGGGLINLRGNNPVIKNGELAGLYDEHNVDESQADETGLIWEQESLVSLTPSGYSNAVVENMKLHNCWGYAICEKGTPYRATWSAKIDDDNMDCDTTSSAVGGTITATDDGGYEYVTRDFSLTDIPSAFRKNLQPPYKRICAQYAGYFRFISDKKIEYTFKDADGTVIGDSIPEVPGMPVEIPEGAMTASVKAFWDEGNETWKHTIANGKISYRHIGLWFMDDFVGNLTVKGCHTYNNYSLGMVGGGTGKTTAQNCVSWGNGRIYDGETYEDRSTVGFIDSEDTPAPYIELDHCYSHDENHFALLGAYNVKVTNCSGKDVIIYGGFGADISTDADATVTSETGETVEAGVYKSGVGTDAASVKTPVTVTNCKMGDFTSGVHAPENVVGKKCELRQIHRHTRMSTDLNDNFNGFKTGKNKFFYEFSGANVKLGDVTEIWEAEIYIHFDGTAKPDCGYIFSKLATDKGTELTIQVSCDDGPTLAGPIKTTGDCYGLCSNVPVIPSYADDGIAGSTFKVNFPIPFSGVTPKGKYEDCTFDTSEECFIKLPRTGNVDSGSFTFNKCTIKNEKNYLLGTVDTTGSYGWNAGFSLYVNNPEVLQDSAKLCKSKNNKVDEETGEVINNAAYVVVVVGEGTTATKTVISGVEPS